MVENIRKKRMPGYPITINKNVDNVREKIQSICKEYDISASLLFEALVDCLELEQWSKFAKIARSRKLEKSRIIRNTRLERTAKQKLQATNRNRFM